jgi:hypothetical protein
MPLHHVGGDRRYLSSAADGISSAYGTSHDQTDGGSAEQMNPLAENLDQPVTGNRKDPTAQSTRTKDMMSIRVLHNGC